jgi:hypothetical protein
MSTSNDIMYDIPLPDPKFEKKRYVAIIRYQKPNKITLGGKRKTSPRFETLYGVKYWLNKQPFHLEYIIYRTDKDGIITHGSKKIGEDIK